MVPPIMFGTILFIVPLLWGFTFIISNMEGKIHG
jgi:hypothetical protein